jgi:hypothetical protein
MNKRDAKLDELCGELVDVTFFDGDQKTGVLEYGMHIPGWPDGERYSLYVFGAGYTVFRKTSIRKIRLHE